MNDVFVTENDDKLVTIDALDFDECCEDIVAAIKEDSLVLLQDIEPMEADVLMKKVSSKLNLYDSLQVQTAFAKTGGNRSNIGKYYMTVNGRDNFEFISAHSEGGSFSNVQLASFYCYENTTDGGESIFFNIDEASEHWEKLRERVVRAKGSPELSTQDSNALRFTHHVNLPGDVIKEDDIVIKEFQSEIADLQLAEVLTKLRKQYSKILNREVYVYWDTVGSIDVTCGEEYLKLLNEENLIRVPSESVEASEFDYNKIRGRRIWESGVKFADLFGCKVTKKLEEGNFVLFNNLTWTHSAANWTPGSGTRKIAASFA